MGEAANVCCASKRAPKRGSPSRPTNACGSLTWSDADHGKKRDPRGDEANEAVQQIYQDHSGRSLTADEIARVASANAQGADVLAELSAAAGILNKATKEEIIRAAYLVLLADDRIAGEERKKLQDIAAELRIPEIHFGAILEDLAIWLSSPRS